MKTRYVNFDFPGRVPVRGTAPRIRIFDTTLRDGEQTPGVNFSVDDKVTIAAMLDGIGVDTIEAGFPASSPGEREAVRAVAASVENAETAALARCVPGDIEAAAQALTPARTPVLHLVYGASNVHLAKKYGVTRADALRRVHRSVSMAAGFCAAVQFSLEDVTRADRVFARQMIATALSAGATRINVPDTVGVATPNEYAGWIREAVQVTGDQAIVSAHCHDDLGMATANSIAAIEAGAAQVEVTVNGIGERAGNAALEELVVAASVKGIAETGVALTHVRQVSKAVATRSGVPVQPNKAVVGEHAFLHSSGIHQDALIKDARTYECFAPEVVGVEGHRFVLTARSGRAAVAQEMRARGVDADFDTVSRVYAAFIEAAQDQPGAELAAIFERIVSEEIANTVDAIT